MNLLKPTKSKILGFIFFIIGSIVFKIIGLVIHSYLGKTLNPQEYLAFWSGYAGIIYTIISGGIYLIWIYILISIVYNMARKKD